MLSSAIQASQMSAELPGPLQASLEAMVTTQQDEQQDEEATREDVVAQLQKEMPTVAHVAAEEEALTPQQATSPLEIREGDVFFALATFVSETGEAMNLVEGERVHVLEWNNDDWW